jgi:hypothetical protein
MPGKTVDDHQIARVDYGTWTLPSGEDHTHVALLETRAGSGWLRWQLWDVNARIADDTARFFVVSLFSAAQRDVEPLDCRCGAATIRSVGGIDVLTDNYLGNLQSCGPEVGGGPWRVDNQLLTAGRYVLDRDAEPRSVDEKAAGEAGLPLWAYRLARYVGATHEETLEAGRVPIGWGSGVGGNPTAAWWWYVEALDAGLPHAGIVRASRPREWSMERSISTYLHGRQVGFTHEDLLQISPFDLPERIQEREAEATAARSDLHKPVGPLRRTRRPPS